MRNFNCPWLTGIALPGVALVSGCAGDALQSAVHPAGPAAAEIAWLWWVMCIVLTVVFLLVLALTAVALLRGPVARRRRLFGGQDGTRPPLGAVGFIVAGGVVLPVLVVTPLYVMSLRASAALTPPRDGLTIRVVGHMWWWEVRYPDADIVTANELHIPAGEPVRLELDSADVIHSFWVPRLNGKRDMIPGVTTVFWIQADRPGIYRGQCAEYCGTQHAKMALNVIALPREEFDAWVNARSEPPEELTSAESPPGLAAFQRVGCGQCHAIRGTAAIGNVGPDLTHLGSRTTLGAAMLPNTRANLMGWIADPQAIKPGVRMPRTYMSGEDLHSIADYLGDLP